MRVRGLAYLFAAAACMFAAVAARAGAAPADLDNSFGIKGVATVATLPNDAGADLALGPKDQIYLLYSSYPACEPPFECTVELTVKRFTADGKPDTSFAGGPQLVVRQSTYDRDFALAVGSDGKPVIAAFDRVEGLVVERLGIDGLPDPAFGTNGRLPHTGAHAIEGARGDISIAVQPDQKVLAAAELSREEGSGRLVVARYLANGEFDAGFGSGGEAVVTTPTQARPHQLLLGPEGSIYIPVPRCCVGGTRKFGEGLTIVKLLADGRLDPAGWGGGSGLLRYPTPGMEGEVTDAALAPDGGLFVLFDENSEALGIPGNLLKVSSGGAPDSAFGAGGRLRVFSRVGLASPDGLAIDARKRIVGVGWDGRMAAFRLRPDGSADRTFGGGHETQLPFGGNDPKQYSIAIQAGGRIVLLGESGCCGPQRTFALLGLRGGTDRTRCLGKRATIVGTARADEIVGTKHRDVIAALGGRDTVRGLGGADLICGGKGKDKLVGGPGRDRVKP